jgi:hypothetical protein
MVALQCSFRDNRAYLSQVRGLGVLLFLAS